MSYELLAIARGSAGVGCVAGNSGLYPSATIKISSCQISIKSVQRFSRESATDRKTELITNLKYEVWIIITSKYEFSLPI